MASTPYWNAGSSDPYASGSIWKAKGYDQDWWSRMNPTYQKNVTSWNPDRGMAQIAWDENPSAAWKTYAQNLADYASTSNHQGGINTGSVINPYAKQAMNKGLQDAQAMYYMMNFGHPDLGAYNALEATSDVQNGFRFMADALMGRSMNRAGSGGAEPAVGSNNGVPTGANIAGMPVWGPASRTQAFSNIMSNMARAVNPNGWGSQQVASQGGRELTPEERQNAELTMQALYESPEMVQNMMNYATRGYGGVFGGAVQNILNRAWDNLSTQGVGQPAEGGVPARTTSDFYNFLSNMWNSLRPGGAY